MYFNWESSVSPKDIKPYQSSYKYMDKDKSLICPICSYKYLARDIYMLIIVQIMGV